MIRNSSQKRAIAHLSGPMLVLAGPGSGKTSVIVERTAQMMEEGGIHASHILVVTFSRAAAQEMKERFLAFRGQERTEVTFGTFHGVFYGILKQEYHLGPGNILSDQEKYDLLKELILHHSQDQALEGEFPEELSREISTVKENRIKPEHYHAASCPDEVFQEIYLSYQARLKEMRKLDFDDMLLYCYQLFVSRPEALARWREKFHYILVDEFQDINRLQYEIIRMLAAPRNNLFAVGDDDQSIYHFRGATPEIMLNFRKDFPGTSQVLLDTNYRCPRPVLASALRLIGHNRKRYQKELQAQKGEGEQVRSLVFDTPAQEIRYCIQRLRLLQERGEDLSHTAILLRTNQEAEGLVQGLMEYQLPFTMKEQLPNLFRHWISEDVMAYLRMGRGDRSRGTLLRIINRPNRYIARELLEEPTIDLIALQKKLSGRDWMEDRITTLMTHLKILSTLSPYAGINFIRKAMGYEEYLQEYAAYRRIKPEDLTETLDRLQESARGMATLEEWQEAIRRYTEELGRQTRKSRQEQEGVVISTLHRSKGLEFDRVMILNVNEGSIPYRKAVLPEALEEERRLLYVGMTRAKQELILCHVRRQYEKKKEPSRFLKEAGL